MKLFIIRYIKIVFVYLRLHVFFNFFSGFFTNLLYISKFSSWVQKNKKILYNDFPCKWNYKKRFDLYNWVVEKESLSSAIINYLEFGVADGHSFRWFAEKIVNPQSRFHGFDTFTGLPEDFGQYKKGQFNTNNKIPEIGDARANFYQGLFQQTLPGFLPQLEKDAKNVIMLDADLYSSTLYVLTSIAPFLKKDDIIFFDEFAVPTHEFKAFDDFLQAYPVTLELIAAANNYYFAAFKVI